MRLDNPALNGSPILGNRTPHTRLRPTSVGAKRIELRLRSDIEGRRDGNAVLPYDRSPLRRVAGTGPLTPFKCAGSWGALMRARVS
jgi:hypothetical protein